MVYIGGGTLTISGYGFKSGATVAVGTDNYSYFIVYLCPCLVYTGGGTLTISGYGCKDGASVAVGTDNCEAVSIVILLLTFVHALFIQVVVH